jgi:hypothetical protein
MALKQRLDSAKQSLKDGKLEGIYFGPFTSNYARVAISGTAGFLITFILLVADILFKSEFLSVGYWMLLGIAFSILIGWNEEKITIPVNHVGFITFLGRRIKVYLKEGDYYWTGNRFLFGLSRAPIANARNVTKGDGEEQGFVYIGTRTLQIWNSRESKKISLTLPARGGSTVTTNLTIKITTWDPMLWASSDDAILQIAEQARAGLRKTLTFFRDIDVSSAKSAVVAIMSGKCVITAFTNKKFESHLVGTMVQDMSGLPLYDVVNIVQLPGESNTAFEQRKFEETELKKADFLRKVMTYGNPDMLKASRDSKEQVVLAVLEVEEKLNNVVAGVGAFIENVVISDAQLSETVRIASEKASSESQQRDQQVTSAKTQAEVMSILAKAKQIDGVDELDRLIAAKADGNEGINITHVTGSADPILKAAVAAAQQIGGNKK